MRTRAAGHVDANPHRNNHSATGSMHALRDSSLAAILFVFVFWGVILGSFLNLLIIFYIFGTFLHLFDPGLGSSILTRRDGSIREVRKPQMPQKFREPCFIFADLGIFKPIMGPGPIWAWPHMSLAPGGPGPGWAWPIWAWPFGPGPWPIGPGPDPAIGPGPLGLAHWAWPFVGTHLLVLLCFYC